MTTNDGLKTKRAPMIEALTKELRHNAIVLPGLQAQMAQVLGKDLTKLPCLNFYSRILAKRGAKVAIKATAYKRAKLIYLVLFMRSVKYPA